MRRPCKPARGFSFLATLLFVALGNSLALAQSSSQSSRIAVGIVPSLPALAAIPATARATLSAIPSPTSSARFDASTELAVAESTTEKFTATNLTAAAPMTLDARDIACNAGRNWPPAIQLRQHAKSLETLYCNERDACTRQTVQALIQFLHLQAERQQDIGSATAMKAYYALITVRDQLSLVAKSDSMLDLRRQQQAKLKQQGVATNVDLTSFEREQIEINLQRSQLQQRERQLLQTLREFYNLPSDWSHVHLETLEIRPNAMDIEQLEQFALTQRQDLTAIHCLSGHINAESAPLLSSSVAGFTGMFSLPLPKQCLLVRLLGKSSYPGLAASLKREVALAAETLAKSIRQSVFEKATTLEQRYREVEFAELTFQSWQKRSSQLKQLAEFGDSRVTEIPQAEASQMAADAQYLEVKLQAKLAEVELAETCGGLHARCCNGNAWLITGHAPMVN